MNCSTTAFETTNPWRRTPFRQFTQVSQTHRNPLSPPCFEHYNSFWPLGPSDSTTSSAPIATKPPSGPLVTINQLVQSFETLWRNQLSKNYPYLSQQNLATQLIQKITSCFRQYLHSPILFINVDPQNYDPSRGFSAYLRRTIHRKTFYKDVPWKIVYDVNNSTLSEQNVFFAELVKTYFRENRKG